MEPFEGQSQFDFAPSERGTTARCQFNPAMLATAREAFRLSQTALSKKLNISQALVGKWEAGWSVPNNVQITNLSNALAVSADLFFVDRSRRLSSMSDYYHRALTRARRVDVKAVHAKCSVMDLQLDRLLELGTIPEDRIPDFDPDTHTGNVEKIAAMARTAMGADNGPIESLTKLIENAGGVVIDQDLGVSEIDALCRWVPELPKLFFVNGTKPPDRIRFSLSHELGHTIMHFARDFPMKLAEEQANAFAAAFLMPAQEIRRDLKTWLSISDLAGIKRKWRVSMQAIAKRAFFLNVIDLRRYKSLCEQMSRNGWRKSEPVSIAGETPQHFRRLLQAHLEAGYSREDLAKLLFISKNDVEKMLVDHLSPTWEDDGVRLRLVR